MNIEEIIKKACKNKSTNEYEKSLRASYEKYKHLTDKNEIKKELDKARIRYDEGHTMYDELADVTILYHMRHN
jgi:hypothetical protein